MGLAGGRVKQSISNLRERPGTTSEGAEEGAEEDTQEGPGLARQKSEGQEAETGKEAA